MQLQENTEIVDLSPEEAARIKAALVEGEDRSSLIKIAIARELKARARKVIRTRRTASGASRVKARVLRTGRTLEGRVEPVVLVETRTGRGWKLHYDRQFRSAREAHAWIVQQGYEIVGDLKGGG